MKKWFKARSYGYGWEPVTWQGWLVVILFVGGLLWNAYTFLQTTQGSADVKMLIIRFLVLLVLMVLIGHLMGEKPKWNWGKRK